MCAARSRAGALIAATALLVTGCGQKTAAPTPPPAEVGVVTAHAQAVPLTRDLVGRLSATRSADVRARVAGVLQKRLYKEGSTVHAGQPLFQIDPTPLRAALDAAQAALAQAQANATNAHVAAERMRKVAAQKLVSQANLDDAEAAERSTAAQVLQAKANLETARINLSYARVTSPIAGRAGQQRVTEGALVGQGEATLLTTVDQIDPIYVNFDQPAAEIERLRREQSTGDVTLLERDAAQVELVMADGTAYPHKGTLDFSDFTVNPTTGALAFRAIVPNPDHTLLPGMYVNIHVTLGTLNHAFLVPQSGMGRDIDGPFVKVVGPQSKVVQKRVTASTLIGQDWVVTSGLADGDALIVQNTQKARPGAPVRAMPVEAANVNGSAGVPSGKPADANASAGTSSAEPADTGTPARAAPAAGGDSPASRAEPSARPAARTP